MQQPRAELNQRLLGALLCAAAGAATLLWVHWPIAGTRPLPPGFPPGMASVASDAALLAGGGACAFTALPVFARAGGFAALAAGALAAGLPLLCEPWCGVDSAAWLGPGAAVVAAAALPLVRERGIVSLCLVPALVLLPACWARQASVHQAHAAAPLRELQQKAPLEGPVGLVLPAGSEWVSVCVTALRQPCFPVDLDVWPVARESPEADWLLRSGVPLLRLQEGRAELQLPAGRHTLPGPGQLRVETAFLERTAGVPDGIRIRAGEFAASGTWAVYTPWGCLTGGLDAEGNGILDTTAWNELQQHGPEPQAGDRIRVLAVSRGDEAAYGWADLCLP
jgi:hypothetical protein